MKLIFLFLIIPLVQVTASTKAQTITLNKQNISITAVFEEIMMQSDYDFSYSEQQISKVGKINISVTNASIMEVLDKCFEGQALTYTISNNTITIKDIPQPFFKRILKRFSAVIISGTISDEQGNPLPGATVKLQGSKTKTSTDDKGLFSLNSDEESGVLNISYLGYVSEQVRFSSNNPGPFKVILKQKTSGLEEVEINAGYYTVKDRDRTGNINKITATSIERNPVLNPLQALQNRIPGMQITQNSGLAGGAFSVQIRGRSSINNSIGNKPLYIIDEVVYPSTYIGNGTSQSTLLGGGIDPLSIINPNDIESIEVLKDADATAIYGSRGANGVILIKTKRGKAGATRINTTFTQGFSRIPKKLDLLNTQEYLEMREEALRNDGLTAGPTDYDINGIYDQKKYTDWQEELIGRTAKTSNAALNVSGGTEQINYILGGNYYREGTVFPGSFDFNRIGLRSSINIGSVKDRFTLSLISTYNHTQNGLTRNDPTGNIFLAPNAPDAYDQYGQLNWANNTVLINPMADLLRKNDITINNMIANLNLNYRFAENLVFKTSVGYNSINTHDFLKTPLASLAPANNPTSVSRRSTFSENSINSWSIEPQLNYTTKIGFGNLDALAGLSFQESKYELRGLEATNFNSDGLMDNILSAGTITPVTADNSQYRYAALFARINYGIANKYYINLTARRDGSSRFGKDRQFANFGAIGAAWIFSEEKLFNHILPFLSFGKLRISYGITGNDQIGDYKYLSLWRSLGSYQGVTTLIPSLGNADYSWETNKKAEIALQLKAFENRLNFEVSYYNNRSSNQLIGDPLPPSTGNNTIIANRPAKVQNTGVEFISDVQLLNTRAWKWFTGINLTIPKNKLLAYPGLENSSDALTYVVGKPLSIQWIYNVTGVDRQTGLYVIEDKDGNGIINTSDRYMQKFTGQYFYGGLQNSISFKNLTLDFLISIVKQTGSNYLSGSNTLPGRWSANVYPYSNQLSFTLDRWREVDDESSVQRFSTTSTSATVYNNARNNGLSLEDASFARLKNISLSYTLPSICLSKIQIDNASISLTGQNIFTVTKYKGFDPENQSLSRLPPLRTLSLGINLTF